MKIRMIVYAAAVMTGSSLLALSDPGFEKSAVGQLPKWNGNAWIRMTNLEFKAEIVEDASKAAEGKRFLLLVNPDTKVGYVGGFPWINCRPGTKYTVTVKARGTGKLNISFNRLDGNNKTRPWSNKASSGYVALAAGDWQEIKLEYTAAPEDVKMCVMFSIKEGEAMVDSVLLEPAE